jgi:hypothetical protein
MKYDDPFSNDSLDLYYKNDGDLESEYIRDGPEFSIFVSTSY